MDALLRCQGCACLLCSLRFTPFLNLISPGSSQRIWASPATWGISFLIGVAWVTKHMTLRRQYSNQFDRKPRCSAGVTYVLSNALYGLRACPFGGYSAYWTPVFP